MRQKSFKRGRFSNVVVKKEEEIEIANDVITEMLTSELILNSIEREKLRER